MNETQLFLFVVDTYDNKLAKVGRGILNAQIVCAKTKEEAVDLFIKLYKPHILQQIQNCTYVYDISEIHKNLDLVDVTKNVPVFSHLPLLGGRPPKPEPLNLNGSQPVNSQFAPPVSSNTQAPPQQQRVVQQPRPSTKGDLTKAQIELIKNFGALPTPQGENDGFNTRVNAAVGNRGPVTQDMVQQRDVVETMTQEQLKMLNSAGVKLSDLRMNVEVNADEVSPIAKMQEEELATVTEKPLSDEEIAALQKQI